MSSSATATLPGYLKRFTAEQRYEKYTAQDHAAWRYIMRQNRAFFSTHAAPVYLDGLEKTGIPVDRIPRISDMDDCLSRFGWGAVAVQGFIPPAAFLDFQARGVLPIACDMRTVNHLAYTPAPDIVHEAAGHAPIIADPSYARYLRGYARMARKAIASIDDIHIYEAIRYLSDIKENPETSAAAIAQAENRLKALSASAGIVSEAAKVARMNWWTVEYGLVGSLDQPLIYGAGLLSSVGESHACLAPKVKKIPLTIDCVETSYDITEPQPQLFVTPTLEHLVEVLENLERTLSYVIGGATGLERAKAAGTVNTIVLDSGLEISGQVAEHLEERGRAVSFFKLAGPVQLASRGEQLPGHGRERHASGFSSPLGRWEGMPAKAPHLVTDAELERLGIRRGKSAELKLLNGFRVKGTVIDWLRDSEGHLICLTWGQCTVERAGKIFFEPAWGEFDQAVGENILSVYGGPADRTRFGEVEMGKATTAPARTTPHTSLEKEIFESYGKLRQLREGANAELEKKLEALVKASPARFTDEWLLGLEALETLVQKTGKQPDQFPWARTLADALRAKARGGDSVTAQLISDGLALLNVPD